MKAVTYQGLKKVKVKNVEDPTIKKEDDILIRVGVTSICGSDLHLYHGLIPSTDKDTIIGHEAIGYVEEIGPNVERVKKGDKVIIPYTVACGHCYYCENQLESQCNESNEEGEIGAAYGCSRLLGDYDGSQAELLRVPYANFSPFVIPEDCELEDEVLLLLTDALPVANWAIEHSGVKPGDTVIVLGSGPVGLLTQKLAWLKGAERVIAVDPVDYRLAHAKKTNKVETFNFEKDKYLPDTLKEITKGGADVVIDCVGMSGKIKGVEVIETVLRLQGAAMGAVTTAIETVKKGGVIQLIGIYGTRYNAFPLGDIFMRNVTLKTGLAPVVHQLPTLYKMLKDEKLNPKDIISHKLPLDQAEYAYDIFNKRDDNCLKIILKP